MAMSELKQKLLQYELAKIGYPDAAYSAVSDRIVVQPGNDGLSVIDDEGEIRFLPENRDFVYDTLKPLVERVNEAYAGWERSEAVPFEDLKQFRVLAEFNDIMLAARDDTESGRGLYFVTWRYNYDRTGLEHGNYTEDYTAAKEDFVGRSELVSPGKFISTEQAVELKAAIEYRIENDGDLTFAKEETLKSIAEKLHRAYPAAIEPEKEQEPDEQSVGDTGRTTTNAINSEIACFDTVISTEYPYLAGEVNAVDKFGSLEHDGESPQDYVFVDFQSEEYSESRIKEIEKHFSELHGKPVTFDELKGDLFNVKTSSDKLLLTTESEMRRVLESSEDAELFVRQFTGYGEQGDYNRAELIARLNKNLVDYHTSLVGFGPRELIDMAGKIAAMSDAHSYMTAYSHFDDGEIDFYLKFQNPLEVVADEWHERRIYLDDMSFVLHDLYDKQNALHDYPLVENYEAPADSTLRRYMNVDLELYLGKIAEKVIIHYPNDWNIDLKTLRQAAASDNPEEKRLFWHVCGFGTHLMSERDTFIKDTGAFSYMTDYRQNDLDMFGYVVEVTGISDNTGAVMGNIFEVGDYAEFAKHIRETAEPLDSLTLIYSDDWGVNAGKAVTVSRREYDDDRHRLMSESGNVKELVYHPKDKVRLAGLITYERSKRMSLPLGSTSELLRKMTDKLAEVRKPPEKPEQAAAKPKTLAEKMQAANEKVKAQDAPNTNTKPQKREERE